MAAAVLVAVPFRPLPALAECDVGETSCFDQDGSNSSEVKIKQDVKGGDGVAGSQIIGVAGADGDVEVNARNSSEFSRARGGDAESKVKVEADVTTPRVVEGSEVTVTPEVSGVTGVTQTAAPRRRRPVTTDLYALPTGGSMFSGTARGVLPGGRRLSPPSEGIAAPVLFFPTEAHGESSKVVLRSSGSAVSGDAVAGGQVIGVVGTTGETVINATNRSVFARAIGGDAKGSLDLSASAGSRLEAFRPDPLSQPGEQTSAGRIGADGDNSVRLDVDLALTGGDAVAGAQVIGLAGVTGSVEINAFNQSRFATARGGDASARVRVHADAGPRITLAGGDFGVTANAEGSAGVTQTADLLAVAAVSAAGVGPGVGELTAATGSAPVQQTSSTAGVAILRAVPVRAGMRARRM